MLRHCIADCRYEIHLLQYLTGTDVIKCKNNGYNLSTLHNMLMKYMTEEIRKRNITELSGKPSEDEVNKLYRKMTGFILSLSDNPVEDSTVSSMTGTVSENTRSKKKLQSV